MVLVLAVVAIGCGNESIIGDRVANTPPQTDIKGAPPVLEQSSFAVPLFWSGSDADGRVVGYQWRISNNGADGIVDVEDTLEANLPWQFTETTDSIFVVSADLDSFGVDVGDSRQGANDYRFWQTHTFFVRAVDDAGMADPTPAYLSFTAITLAPTVAIDLPRFVPSNSCSSTPRVMSFGWTGSDPDDPKGDPEAIRYLLIPWGSSSETCLTKLEYAALSPVHNDDARWSEWIRYDAPADSGRFVTLQKLDIGSSFIFAVQSRDIAGAVTPTFEWGRNVRHVRTTSNKFPILFVNERFLGTDNYVARNKIKAFEIVQGQGLEFKFSCDASYYGGLITDYRWGWDVADVGDPQDPGWGVGWGTGPAFQRLGIRAFLEGSHNAVMQCRDNSGTISQAVIQLVVVQVAPRIRQRPLLLVDDWRLENTPQTRALEQQWDREWEALLKPHLATFQPDDIIDTQDSPARMKFRTVNEYKSVIWFTNSSNKSFLHTNFAPISPTKNQFNWLEIYQAKVGNLMIVGPGAMAGSLESRSPPLMFPIPFNTPDRGALGFGTEERVDGTLVNRGITRWPYSAWCLSLIDVVRPPLLLISGETPTRLQRNLECDGLVVAQVADEMGFRYPDSREAVVDLRPKNERLDLESLYKPSFEEFYDTNPTSRRLSLTLRDCQTPMFVLRSRREERVPGVPVGLCPPKGSERSTVEGAPVAILSSRYSDSKQLVGSEDVLWGFHPLSFNAKDVEAALVWVLRNRWDLRVH